MQNWDSLQTANYELNWYNNTFSAGKIDSHPTSTTMEQCFNMRQQPSSMDVTSPTPSPRNSDCQEMNYLDNSTELTSSGTHHPLGFNPLTPPGLPNAVLPSMNFQSSDLSNNSHKQENDMKIDENSLTPRNTPPVDVTPPKSPKNFNNHEPSLDNDMISNSSEDTRFIESEDDELIRVPIYNSHGKMKNYKCKHCGFLAITKIAFWNHAREHIKPEKMLQCPKCPFVTELKHHLEYHIRKHKNLKPFQCDKCNYSCVNKSMLNSHLKSHSSVYQYRCSDCDYATKYCHSFKLHLRKYDHKPGMVLDEDGTPNPSVVIDVYGTRRGPKMKATKSKSKGNLKVDPELEVKAFHSNEKIRDQKNQLINDQLTTKLPNEKNVRSPVSNLLPNNLANMLHQTRNMPFLPYFNLNLQMIAAQQHAAWTQIPSQIQQNFFRTSDDDGELNKSQNTKEISDEEDNIVEEKCEPINGAMDLSQTTLIKADVLIQNQNPAHHYPVKEEQNTPTITSSSSSSSKRKSRHNKLEGENHVEMDNSLKERSHIKDIKENDAKKIALDSKTELPSSSSQDDYKNNNSNENHHEKSASTSSSPITGTSIDCSTSTTTTHNNTNFQIPGVFECKYCDIYFKDAVLYTIHMGYHSCDDVFKCNMCGEKCDGPVGLFIHMARNAHS